MEAKEGTQKAPSRNELIVLEKVGLHCDRQHAKNNLDVVGMVKKQNDLTHWFSGESDIARRLESASQKVKKTSLFYANIIKANGIINDITSHSVKKLSKLKAFSSCHWHLRPKTHSETKFVGHLSTSFKAIIRCLNGIIHLFAQNLSPTNQKCRNNINYTKIIQSAHFQFGHRLINDIITTLDMLVSNQLNHH